MSKSWLWGSGFMDARYMLKIKGVIHIRGPSTSEKSASQTSNSLHLGFNKN